MTMLPTGFPGVVRDGIDALRWAGAALERALPKVQDWVAELAPSAEKAVDKAKERARRQRVSGQAEARPPISRDSTSAFSNFGNTVPMRCFCNGSAKA